MSTEDKGGWSAGADRTRHVGETVWGNCLGPCG